VSCKAISQKHQQIEGLICHDTFMRMMHGKIMAKLFHDMRGVHMSAEKTLLVGWIKQAYIGFNRTQCRTQAREVLDAFKRKRT
jgi:hypothetical protein